MCGLFGIYNYNQRPLDEFQIIEFGRLAKLNKERGPVSAGMLALTTIGNDRYLYQHEYWLDHVLEKIVKFEEEPFALLAHCRAPTSGSNTHVQPFQSGGILGASYFAHNGLILDMPSLVQNSGLQEADLIDTHHLHKIFVREADKVASTNITYYLDNFNIPGSYTFWWWYAGKLMLGRNQGTLYLEADNKSVLFSSIRPSNKAICLEDGEFKIINESYMASKSFQTQNPLL